MRILFVDDEISVLEGLERSLALLKPEWKLAFATTGKEALEKLAQAPYDVIVTDIIMPEIDGVKLLQKVRKSYPEVIRFALSGQSDQETSLQSATLVHQYLAKPCESGALIGALSRGNKLNKMLASEKLRRVISRVGSLPSLPSLYYKLSSELSRPEPSIKRVGEIISKDLGMTSKILQLVNSAFFGLPRHVSSPAHAVSLLGLDVILGLAVSVHMFAPFDQSKFPFFSLDQNLLHSTAVGTCARNIAAAEGLKKMDVDIAFISGILHDVGKLLMVTSFWERYKKAFITAIDQEIQLIETEAEEFGTTHAEIGAYLLRLWGLSNKIVEVIAFHHDPRAIPLSTFSPLAAVHVSNHFANETLSATRMLSSGKLDEEYLVDIGVSDRLPAWQEICEKTLSEKEDL